MRSGNRDRWTAATAVAALMLTAGGTARAQATGRPGFGLPFMPRKQVQLRRALPPAFNAAGRSVAVQTEPGANGQIATLLRSSLEGFLTHDGSVTVRAQQPDILITCSPSTFIAPHPVTENNNGTQSTMLQGSLEVIYRITLGATGQIIASNRTSASGNVPLSQTTAATGSQKVFGIKMKPTGPTTTQSSNETPQQMQDVLVSQVASTVAAYLVSTVETITVPLAQGGSLNEPDKLALGGLWSRDLEQLAAMGAFADARSDSFRQYNIGVANEALAYGTQDSKDAITYLTEASTAYGKAIDAQGGEQQFIVAQDRIKSALALYKAKVMLANTVAKQQQEAQQAEATRKQQQVARSAAEPSLTNADVIAMVGAHMDEGNILDTIANASSVQFQLSAQDQIKLTKAGVNGRELSAMKLKARGAAGAH